MTARLSIPLLLPGGTEPSRAIAAMYFGWAMQNSPYRYTLTRFGDIRDHVGHVEIGPYDPDVQAVFASRNERLHAK